MSNNNIEGIPEGLELVAIRAAKCGDVYIAANGSLCNWENHMDSSTVYPIIRKIEKPKQYRQFANAEEFKPHRDRWWRFKSDGADKHRPPCNFCDRWHDEISWKESFERKVFDDGTPFGVEVTE